jgi:hypothetical protein
MTDDTQPQDTTPQEPAVSDDSLLTAPTGLDFSQGKPEEFPAEFWNEEGKAVNIDALYDAFKNRDKIAKDLREKIGRKQFDNAPPKDINEYTIELKEDLKDLLPADDPIIAKAKEVAKEAGLPKEAFAKFMTPMVEAVLAMRQDVKPPSPEEIAEAKNAELAKIGPNGKQMAQAVNGWLASLEKQGVLTKETLAAAQSMVYNAETLKVMNTLRSMVAPSGPPIALPISQDSSRAEIEAKMVEAAAKRDEATYNKYAAMLRSA